MTMSYSTCPSGQQCCVMFWDKNVQKRVKIARCEGGVRLV